MPNITSVGLTAGVPTSGTGTVSTIDNVIGIAGTPSTAVLTVQGVTSGTAIPATITNANPNGIALAAASAPVVLASDSPGQISLGQANKANSVPVTMASDQAGTYKHIAAGQATTVVKAAAGTLYAIVWNTVATATNVTTIYDNATGSGTVIAIPTATAVTAGSTTSFGPIGAQFLSGLTIITTTANGADMTVVYV